MSPSLEAEPATERKLRSSTRNPRRRQRQSENDTLKTTAPRRKRSKISADTFKPRDSTELVSPYEDDDEIDVGNSISVAKGHAAHHLQHHNHRHHSSTGSRNVSNGSMSMALVGSDVELAMRGGRKGSVKRTMRSDGATVLTQNDYYSVKMLPSTPKELRREGVEYRGSIGEGAAATLAVAVTRERAVVWDYTAHVPSANQRVFDVPFASKSSDPLPFASLVSNGAGATDVGLLLVSATSGKVIFYETVDRAASFGLFPDRKAGIEGSLGSLQSGEIVTDLQSADHAGFIAVFSSGRIARLTLRDAQGKPDISSQSLRAAEPAAGGLLGSIKGFWSSGLYVHDLSAVHVRPLSVRGQMQVVSLTEKAEIYLWDLEWSGRSDFRGSIDLREAIAAEVKALDTPETASKSQSITALDFAIMDTPVPGNGMEVATIRSGQSFDLTVLLCIGTADMRDYMLAEASIVDDQAVVTRLLPIKSYHGGSRMKKYRRPQLLIPRPGHTAYAVFEDAVVLVMSKEIKLDGPAAQLSTAVVPAITFEDVITLRSDKHLAFQSANGKDSNTSQSTCVAFVKSAGLVRISTHELGSALGDARISAKTQIEQAVFHGILQDNILDFSRRQDTECDLVDVESAALDISDEILRATSPFIPAAPTSMEQHLASKARALSALVAHVRQNFPPLPQSSMWRLLWDAERIAAGQQLWLAFEEHVAATMSKGKRKATLLDELCAWFDSDENEQFPHRKDVAGEDSVRRFFIAGLHRFDKLLQHTRTFLRDHQENLRAQSAMAPNDILQLVVQTNDVWLRSLEAAFAFRVEHAAEYGIHARISQDGILAEPTDYAGLGEFWTSMEPVVSACIKVATMSREFATKIFEKEEASDAIDPVVREISLDNPRLIQLYCLICQECINWRASRPSERDQETARKLTAIFDATRYDQFRGLAEVGQVEAGMALAEKHRDMHTLTDMVVAEDQYLDESSKDPTLTEIEKGAIVQSRRELDVKIRRFFDRYGEAWADAFFDMAFSGNAAGIMLTRAQLHWKTALTRYLQARPSRAKICWINDVTEEQDFVHAGSVLAQAATDQESRLWAKKVELSMSKLALMAAAEAAELDPSLRRPQLLIASTPAKELVVADVQDKLYKHIHPEIVACIDRQAELEVCMQRFGSRTGELSALRQLLEQGFNMILDHTALSVEELIDVLTLMNSVINPEVEGNLQGSEFYLALTALNAAASSLPPTQVDTLQQVIWKRCYIYDDWAKLKLGAKQSDEERQHALRSTAVWRTYFHVLDAGFFAQADCVLSPLAPKDCLGAVCAPGELAHRFPNEDLLDPILHDLRIQDELLAGYVVDRRLDEVVAECRRNAQALLDEQAAELAQTLADERAVEAALDARENGAAGTRPANGGIEKGAAAANDADDNVILSIENGFPNGSGVVMAM